MAEFRKRFETRGRLWHGYKADLLRIYEMSPEYYEESGRDALSAMLDDELMVYVSSLDELERCERLMPEGTTFLMRYSHQNEPELLEHGVSIVASHPLCSRLHGVWFNAYHDISVEDLTVVLDAALEYDHEFFGVGPIVLTPEALEALVLHPVIERLDGLRMEVSFPEHTPSARRLEAIGVALDRMEDTSLELLGFQPMDLQAEDVVRLTRIEALSSLELLDVSGCYDLNEADYHALINAPNLLGLDRLVAYTDHWFTRDEMERIRAAAR